MPRARSTLLIVEKDEATRELYQRELSRTYRVIAAEDTTQALKVLQTEEVAAVVLEPAASGDADWALIASIHLRKHRAPIPIILCTALDERRRGLELGAAAYLIKPVLPVTLLNTLKQVLQG
jgi:response regulator RpfG family c-di-GMP phosphodiesterase